MIVKCASCQTRFKIGDDKVTEKGVKVRCTKCGTVFVVRKGDDSASGPAPSPRSKTPLPSAVSSVGSLDDLFSMPVLATGTSTSPSSDAANLDDPFAGFLSGTPSPPPAPTGAPATPPKNNLMPGEFALAPSGAASGVSSGSATPGPPGSTPMSDLLGLDAWPPAAPPPTKSPASKPPRSGPRSPTSKPPKPPPDAIDPFEGALDPLGSPGSVHPPPDPFANFASSASDPASFGLASGDAAGQSESNFDPLAGLSLDPAVVSQTGNETRHETSGETAAETTNAEATSELFEQPPPRHPLAQPVIETQHSETTVERQRGAAVQTTFEDEEDPADRPLSARIFNALAGASVVILALLAFVAYRNGGRVDLHDPLSAFFTAFGFSRPTGVSQSLSTRITQSGLYSNLRGDPILFVRGSVENRSGAPQRVGLKLEVSSQGQIVASAEGVPGLFPTPEDLFQAKDAPEMKAVLDRVFSEPQPLIPPGGKSEFLLVVPSVPPAVLSSTEQPELKVTAHPVLSAADLPQHAATN